MTPGHGKVNAWHSFLWNKITYTCPNVWASLVNHAEARVWMNNYISDFYMSRNSFSIMIYVTELPRRTVSNDNNFAIHTFHSRKFILNSPLVFNWTSWSSIVRSKSAGSVFLKPDLMDPGENHSHAYKFAPCSYLIFVILAGLYLSRVKNSLYTAELYKLFLIPWMDSAWPLLRNRLRCGQHWLR